MIRKSIVYFLCMLCFSQCNRDFSVPFTPETKRELTPQEKQLIQADNNFGFKLFRQIAADKSDSSIVISPLSISMALGMTYNGAAGTTEQAMRNTLELGSLTSAEINESYKSLMILLPSLDPEIQFHIANSIWYRLGFIVEQDFINLNQTYFNAEVRSLDFSLPASVDIINNWVEQNTFGKIDQIIDSINPQTVMFLINCIYFKGTWTTSFDPELTTEDWFYKQDGSQILCSLMEQKGNFQYLDTPQFQAIDLPYGDGLFSMTIILPGAETSIDALIQAFTPDNWAQWLTQFSETQISLFLPRLKLEYKIKLNDALTALGMGIAFSGQADFSGINKNGGLYINKVYHKTFLELDEQGTEAAAVTVVEIWETSAGPVMRADHPFIFVIREKYSDTILFMGKIIQPEN